VLRSFSPSRNGFIALRRQRTVGPTGLVLLGVLLLLVLGAVLALVGGRSLRRRRRSASAKNSVVL